MRSSLLITLLLVLAFANPLLLGHFFKDSFPFSVKWVEAVLFLLILSCLAWVVRHKIDSPG